MSLNCGALVKKIFLVKGCEEREGAKSHLFMFTDLSIQEAWTEDLINWRQNGWDERTFFRVLYTFEISDGITKEEGQTGA